MMLFFNRQFFTWLMVLVMMISPLQASMATDFSTQGHAVNCHGAAALSQSPVSVNCPSGHDNSDHNKQCQSHPGCIASFVTTLPFSHSILLPAQSALQVKFISDDEAVQSRYASLLKRPPKSS